MDIREMVERISQKIASKGKTPDKKKIETKLRRLIEEFGVHANEAERTVLNELAKEYSLSSITAKSSDMKEIGSLLPGEWVTIEGKVVSLSTPPTPAIAQAGILADPSGAIRFVVWSRAGTPPLTEGSWYRIESAVVDEYRGSPSLSIHTGTTIAPSDQDIPIIPEIKKISELKPGIGNLRAKMIQEWEPSHPRMLQVGLLGDESGTIKFTIWKDSGKEPLELDKVYSIYYAQVDEFGGRLGLNLTGAMYVPEEMEIVVRSGETVSGALVHIAPGSGLVKRCPVDGCNRVLSRQNYCPVHEIQSTFRYDLRIKGVLDSGTKTYNLLISRPVVEQMTGMSLEAAVELAENNPLGMDEVFFKMRDLVQGRYFICRGSEMEDRVLVKECTPLAYDTRNLADLLNRAGGAP
ncbi:MAG: nucleotide-binding protein [Methanomicrobiales archaeon]|nr:nucleotide-binding protein [Methanomicrobiales archaeon]